MSPQLAHSAPPIADVTPTDAWNTLSKDPTAQLIDVRTTAEWMFTGQPDLSSIHKNIISVSWKVFPGFALNPRFAEEVRALGIKQDAPLYFICRSGGRSLDAAMYMATQGYTHCFNIAGGFEGEPDASGHRGMAEGWKASSLPWRQS